MNKMIQGYVQAKFSVVKHKIFWVRTYVLMSSKPINETRTTLCDASQKNAIQ